MIEILNKIDKKQIKSFKKSKNLSLFLDRVKNNRFADMFRIYFTDRPYIGGNKVNIEDYIDIKNKKIKKTGFLYMFTGWLEKNIKTGKINYVVGIPLRIILNKPHSYYSHQEIQLYSMDFMKDNKFFDITDIFLESYFKYGTCGIDPDHTFFRYTDEDFIFNENETEKICKYCKVYKEKYVITKKVIWQKQWIPVKKQ